MEIRQLKYFVTIADTGTFSEAARQLHMSQPPLSQQIVLLEEELGTKLFRRGSRHTELTEAGRLFYNYAETILKMADESKQAVADEISGTVGTIRIGIVSSTVDCVLQKYLYPFIKRNPQIHIELAENNTYALLSLLENEQLDLAFIRTPFPKQTDCSIKQLQSANLVVVSPDPLFPGNRVSLSQAAAKPYVTYRRWQTVLTARFQEAGLSFSPSCLADDARTCLAWAETFHIAAIIPSSVPVEQMHVWQLSPGISSQLCLAVKKDSYHTTAVQHLIDSFDL